MTKALFKKQMREVFSWVSQNRKTGKARTGASLAIFIAVYVLLFAFLAVMFGGFAVVLCPPLVGAGLGWLYFALMGLLAVAFGTFGSVFSTYTTLYQAKDNDMLLAMPIPPAKILLVRLSGVYAIGLLYELIVIIPAAIVYLIVARPGILGVIFTLLIPLVLSFFVLTLSAALGWVVALVSGRVRNKNIVTVVLSLAFFALYYYFCMNSWNIMESIIENPEAIGGFVKGALFPLYHMGLAAQGHAGSMLLFTAIVAALLLLVYFALSKSFVRITTEKKGAAKATYRAGAMRARSVGGSLFHKELRRFLGSATYMLNCGLGIVFMLVAAVALLIEADAVRAAMAEFSDIVSIYGEGVFPVVAVLAVCLLASMNDMTAPSVSLEGKQIWILQSLPVPGEKALMAKLKLQLVFTFIPAAVLCACAEWVLRPSALYAVLIPATAALHIVFLAALGLFANLKMPNLIWTNENVPIKQGLAVTVVLLGGMVFSGVLFGAYFFVGFFLDAAVYLAIVCVLLFAADALLLWWLRTRGARIFEELAA